MNSRDHSPITCQTVYLRPKPFILVHTSQQYSAAARACREIFLRKMSDYGLSWRILRPSSLTDQLYIKAQRIRSIEEKQTQLVEDGIDSEFIGIVNYCAMALIQIEKGPGQDSDPEAVVEWYDQAVEGARALMEKKNHDYGEAWRDMRVSSMTDLILVKLLRIKHIEDNDGKTQISEGVEANYSDIMNYAIFALILRSEHKNSQV
jgi:hypothetical protein